MFESYKMAEDSVRPTENGQRMICDIARITELRRAATEISYTDEICLILREIQEQSSFYIKALRPYAVAECVVLPPCELHDHQPTSMPPS